MPIRPPQRPFRVEEIEVIQIPKVSSLEPIIQYRDRDVERVVEKIVYQDDPQLLSRLNAALKECGELKARMNKMPIAIEPLISERVVEKIIYKDLPGISRDLLIKLILIAFIVGVIACYVILR